MASTPTGPLRPRRAPPGQQNLVPGRTGAPRAELRQALNRLSAAFQDVRRASDALEATRRETARLLCVLVRPRAAAPQPPSEWIERCRRRLQELDPSLDAGAARLISEGLATIEGAASLAPERAAFELHAPRHF